MGSFLVGAQGNVVWCGVVWCERGLCVRGGADEGLLHGRWVLVTAQSCLCGTALHLLC